MTEIEELKAQIKVLEKKLSFLEEMENHKTPCEIAYKDWRGMYPGTGTWDSFDATRWIGFEAGYNASYKQKAQERGERVHNEMEEVVRESVEWCEDHPNENPLDWLTPKTPEETAESLREAFVKVQQTEKWKEIQKKIDDGDFDDFIERTNLLDFLKDKLGYSLDCCYEIVDVISEWLPETQSADGSQNAYVECTVEGWNDCINAIRGKLQ